MGRRRGASRRRRARFPEPNRINGQPGVVFRGPKGGVSVMSFEIVGGRVATIRSIANPDKLGHLEPVESFRAVLVEAR